MNDTRPYCEVPGCTKVARTESGEGLHWRCWGHADVGPLPTDAPPPPAKSRRPPRPPQLPQSPDAAFEYLKRFDGERLFREAARVYCQFVYPNGVGCGAISHTVRGGQGRCREHLAANPRVPGGHGDPVKRRELQNPA